MPMKTVSIAAASSLLLAAIALVPAATAPADARSAGHFTAGEPGNAKQPSRTIKVSLRDEGKRMFFEPARIVVRKGEQIRFKLFNDGIEDHEFVLATANKNRAHAAEMKKHPHMRHKTPNALTLSPFNGGELVWRFTKAGTFEYACLIPGHLEAGMRGIVVVKN